MKSALHIEPKDYSDNGECVSDCDDDTDSMSKSASESKVFDGNSLTPKSKKKNKNVLSKKLSQSMDFKGEN